MAILIENNKLKGFIQNGPENDLKVFSKSIHAVLDFYLCKAPYTPISQDQAGIIYFLKWLDKTLTWEPSQNSRMPGKIVCIIPKNDIQLLEFIIESLDSGAKDILKYGAECGLSKEMMDSLNFLNIIRSALSLDLRQLNGALTD